jgi:redox-sensitive bicupin YhaK (pirin superfamily)
MREHRATSMPFGSTWPMTLLDIVLEPQALLCESVAAAERTFVLVLSGTAELSDGTSAGAGDIVWYVPERSGGNERRSIRLRARGDVRVLLLSSPVIDDPIVAHGPFVMNTHAQIREAYADLENNVFVRAAPLSALD